MIVKHKPLHTSLYTGESITKSTNVKQQNIGILEYLKQTHDTAAAFIPQFPEKCAIDETQEEALNKEAAVIKQLKQKNCSFFLASAFGTADKPNYPDFAPRAIKKNGGILRDFIALDYDLTDINDANQLLQNIYQAFTVNTPVNFALYPSISYPRLPRFRFVLPVNRLLDKQTYKIAAENLIERLNIETNDYVSNVSISHAFNAPFYIYEEAPQNAVFQFGKATFSANELLPETKTATKKEEDEPLSVSYRNEQLDQAIQILINDTDKMNELNDYDAFWRFAESLAENVRLERISEDFAHNTLKAVACGNSEWETNNLLIYETQKQKLINQPDKRDLVKPLTYYLPIMTAATGQNTPQNLTQLFVQTLPSGFHGDTDMDVQLAADLVQQFFEFALLPGFESDSDALAIFNPLTGLWTHSENEFISLLSIVKPAITPVQIKTAILYWAATANRFNRYLKPYAGTQYLVFQNGVLDIIDMKLHPLASDKVKQLQFTTRHLIQLDYRPDVPLKVFENDGLRNNDWTIEQFINAYAGNDPQVAQYFLFGLSLGLFAGHNTGVHFDIQGESGSGKSTLALIYRGLFGPARVAEILFSDLNKDFPLSGFHPDTAVIWVKECNTGITPLDNDHGTPFYDGLADGMMRIPVKHGADQIVADPPQTFIDGTQLIQSTDILTGPARRTLAFKLPSPIEPYRAQFYSNFIHERLADPDVLMWLENEMIKAFKEIVPQNRWAHFKMNLGLKSDLELLPKKALSWRQEFVSADANIREWFDEDILPSLQINNPEGWLTNEFFYKLYIAWYKRRNQQDLTAKYAKRLTNFVVILEQLFEEEQLMKIEFRDASMRNRKKIPNPESWGFTWSVYEEMFMRPIEMESANNWKEVYSKKVGHVYRLVNEKPNSQYYNEKTPLIYVPKEPTAKIPVD